MAIDKRKHKGKKFLNGCYFRQTPQTIEAFDSRPEAQDYRFTFLQNCSPGWRVWISQRPYSRQNEATNI